MAGTDMQTLDVARQYMNKRKAMMQWRGATLFAIPAAFVACGASDYVSSYSLVLARNIYVSAGVVWTALYLAMFLAGMPISVVQFRIDRKFDLARGDVKRRVIDSLKAHALGFVFGVAVVETVFVTMNLPGDYAWMWAAAGVSLVYAALVYVMPQLLPLFYRMTPLTNQQLAARLKILAQRAGVQVADVYEWHISGRTRRANAMVAGFGKKRKIILTDTLVHNFTEDEIEALIAHEFGHCAHHDILKRVLLRTALFVPVLWAVQAAILYQLFPGTEAGWSNPAVVPVFWCLWLMLTLYSNIAMAAVARSQERSADRFAWEQVPSVLPFISAMNRFTSLNLVAYDKGSEWKHTHPATTERIAAAEKFAHERGQLGAAVATA
ncbi:MAG: M48 family metalloprotease [Terriglobales bacterium]